MMNYPILTITFIILYIINFITSLPVITLPIDIKHTAGLRIIESNKHILNHDNTIRSLQTTSKTTTSIGGCYSTDFTVSVSIGDSSTQAVQGPYKLIIDTGSTTLGVVGSACPNDNSSNSCYGASPVYTPTSPATTGTIEANYGSGGWQGAAYSDIVSVANTV